MKLSKISLKWKLFFYILLFSFLVILIFCVFQILLLDKVYKTTKIKQTKSLMSDVYEYVNETDIIKFNDDNVVLVKNINELLENKETDVYLLKQIYTNNELDYINVFTSTGSNFSDKILTKEQLNKVFLGIEKVGEAKFVVLNDDERPEFQQIVTSESNVITNDTIIYCERVKLADNQTNYMIILYSRITPVKPAVDTLKTQLIYITLIVMLLSVILALIMSKSISKPIVDITTTAKKLGSGNYENLSFNGKGYKEVVLLNDTLNYAVLELSKTETLQRELIANVSHDLRTPLTLISGYAEMMRDFPDDDQSENVQVIIDEVKRLSNLVSDLLVLSKMSSRTEPLNKTRINLTNLINSIVSRQQKLLENQGFTVVFNYDTEVYIVGDASKIEQVVYNFISNAVNYSGSSKLIKVEQLVINEEVKISIIDEGIGIKKEDLEYVWDRYYRVDKTHQRPTEGSGLGLSIIKEILEYHNFKYGVKSFEGKGSTFWFTAPIDK